MRKNITRRQVLAGAGALLLAHLAPATPYQTPVQPVEIWRGEWHDAKRNRAVPVKIYFPKGDGPFPVVLFSHGLGGSREGYAYLGNYWAAHGYISVHVQHIGSDDSLWKGGDRQRLRGGITLQTAVDRPRDISFAIDELEALNKTGGWPLHGKLDLSRIGMAGHSFGANTTLLIAGLKPSAVMPVLADRRIKCAIAMSSPPPLAKNYEAPYTGIKIPMWHMTGTKDATPLDTPGASPIDRRIPYDRINNADGYLVTFKDGDHMLFAGQRPGGRIVSSDERNHVLIQQATTAFWDAYLKSEESALTWLRTSFAKELGGSGVFEQKPGRDGE